PRRPRSCRWRFRSCFPRPGEREFGIGFSRLGPVALAHWAAAEPAALDQPGYTREQLARAAREGARRGELTAGERGTDERRAASGDVLDRTEQQVMDRV